MQKSCDARSRCKKYSAMRSHDAKTLAMRCRDLGHSAPNHQNGVSKMLFFFSPEVSDLGFCVKISRILNIPEFPGPSRCQDFGVPIFKVLRGKMKLILASRRRCDFQNAETLPFSFPHPNKRGDFSAIFWRLFCDFCSKTCDFALCDLKRSNFFCDCEFFGR